MSMRFRDEPGADMSVRKFGKSWYVDVSWRGKRHRLRSPDNTIAGARALEQRMRRALAERGDLNELDPAERRSEPTFAEFAERWMRDYVVPNNKPSEVEKKRYVLRRTILPRFGNLPLREVTPESIERFKAALLAGGLAPKSVNNQLAILRRALVLAVEWGELDRVATIRLLKTSPHPIRALKLGEIDRLAHAASSPFWRALVIVAGYTGARFSELIALEWDDLDLASIPPSVTISRGAVRGRIGPTKTYLLRSLPLPTVVVEPLRIIYSVPCSR